MLNATSPNSKWVVLHLFRSRYFGIEGGALLFLIFSRWWSFEHTCEWCMTMLLVHLERLLPTNNIILIHHYSNNHFALLCHLFVLGWTACSTLIRVMHFIASCIARGFIHECRCMSKPILTRICEWISDRCLIDA